MNSINSIVPVFVAAFLLLISPLAMAGGSDNGADGSRLMPVQCAEYMKGAAMASHAPGRSAPAPGVSALQASPRFPDPVEFSLSRHSSH